MCTSPPIYSLLYNVSCSTCEMLYIGETGRPLRARFGQHRYTAVCTASHSLKRLWLESHLIYYQYLFAVFRLYRTCPSAKVHQRFFPSSGNCDSKAEKKPRCVNVFNNRASHTRPEHPRKLIYVFLTCITFPCELGQCKTYKYWET